MSSNGIELYAFDTKRNKFYAFSDLDQPKMVIKDITLPVESGDKMIQLCPAEFQIVLCITRKGYCFALDTKENEILICHQQKVPLDNQWVSSGGITSDHNYLILSCYKVKDSIGLGIIFKKKISTAIIAFEILEDDLKKVTATNLPDRTGKF